MAVQNVQPVSRIVTDFIGAHLVSIIFFTITLATVLGLLVARWWLRRRWRQMLEERFQEEDELDAMTPLGPKDQDAQELIKRFRNEVWGFPESELQLNAEVLSQHAIRIVRAIAAVYHPAREVPQYQATLVESVQLIRRISSRLVRLASVPPFSFLGSRKLSDYQRFYQVYRKINENPILQVLKRNPHIYKAARWAMNVKNLGNPLYWAGKEISREAYFYGVRWFYLTFIGQVGKEAMRLYSGRHFQTEEDRDAVLACHRMFALARRWGGPSSEEWPVLVEIVSAHSTMEPETKLHILSSWTQNKLPKDLDEQFLQTKAGIKGYRQGLKRLADIDSRPNPAKAEMIKQELIAAESPPDSPETGTEPEQ